MPAEKVLTQQPDIYLHEPSPKLNARFANRLRPIVEGIGSGATYVEQALREPEVFVRELHGFLEYEIDRAFLTIEKLRWKDRVDPKELEEAEAWLKNLEKIKSSFPPDRVQSSLEYLRNFKEALQDVLLQH
jgi:hypothetical protein